ncbi:MAG: S24 family peptidase [Cardiobacteriaceae bacterium]|nr:S24 family peptidase [Cardiobacteriaceae bacterium]
MSSSFLDVPAHLIDDSAPRNLDDAKTTDTPLLLSKSLMQKMGLNPKHCGFVVVEGEAMKPTIEGECLLLLDFSANKLKDGRIFALEIGTRVLVRRVQILLDRIVLLADNPDYPKMEIVGENMQRLKVIGQVRYMGRAFQ